MPWQQHNLLKKLVHLIMTYLVTGRYCRGSQYCFSLWMILCCINRTHFSPLPVACSIATVPHDASYILYLTTSERNGTDVQCARILRGCAHCCLTPICCPSQDTQTAIRRDAAVHSRALSKCMKSMKSFMLIVTWQLCRMQHSLYLQYNCDL